MSKDEIIKAKSVDIPTQIDRIKTDGHAAWLYERRAMYRTLKGLRAELGKSQEEMAKFLGCAVGTYVKYEKGKSQIPFSYVVKIADACGLDDLRQLKI